MWKSTLKIIVFVVILSNRNVHVDAVCNVCKNGFTCVSENEFQLCFGDRPDTSRTYTCPNADDVCSQFGRICMPKDQVKPACRGIQNCGCDNVVDYRFACTSRTTFTMCLNKGYTTTRGSCPTNMICNVELGRKGNIPCDNKCVDEVSDALICDFDSPVDAEPESTTTTPETGGTATTEPTTDTTTSRITTAPPISFNDFCRQQARFGRFAPPNDTQCTDYIYCYSNGSEWVGSRRTCPLNKFFDSRTQNCGSERPTECGQNAPNSL